ncbi:phage distal tail protein [Streptomyces virginiae]|uniref:phage distal tail protein n=1 Tax=Streptomyces virginiae TaxID=1961 RepID=UPI003442CC99
MPYIPGASLGGRRADLGSLSLGMVDASGVAWHLQGLEGWDGADQRAEYTPREADHGAWAAPVYLSQRPIVLKGKIEAPDLVTLDASMEQLIAAVTLTDTTLTVYDTTPKRATVRRSGAPLIQPLTDRIAEYSLLVTAADPRRYSTTLQTQSTALPSVTGGLSLPLTLPLVISATTVAGSITLTNLGSFPTRPTLSLSGPVVTPTIVAALPSGVTTQILYGADLQTGDVLVIDSNARTVTLNGTASRRLYFSGTWPEIPANSSVTYSWSSPVYDAAAMLTGTCRSAWM